jgi:hypothetical protein
MDNEAAVQTIYHAITHQTGETIKGLGILILFAAAQTVLLGLIAWKLWYP